MNKEMFIVLKNGRKVRNVKFSNYEAARQFVRKQIRASKDWAADAVRMAGLTPDGSNPGIGFFGYVIKRLDA